ncbi:lipoyl synthase [candidate division TA06 bacterium]|uniref:Lipoyl synthase n=1 Tax=candidate division TA06 bacterium TaxID=2250710 RepID=A0A933IAE9_UNCT6|nr:lipoyl synthase [candidate division TA06 bacterium]
MPENQNHQRLPRAFKQSLVRNPAQAIVSRALSENRLETVCRQARCPNRNQCFASGTATFLIMGGICTRNCRFCAVAKGRPGPLDGQEPQRLARAVKQLGLKYAVITSVTRDDLADGGAGHFAETVRALRRENPGILTEILTSDFNGREESWRQAAEIRPEVFNHNLETVPRLYSQVRPQADYRRSLSLINYASRAGLATKSGLMVGLGEEAGEIKQVMADLKEAGCRILTVGQYLAPSPDHLPVRRFWDEAEYQELKTYGEKTLGLDAVVAGPAVRSSYLAYQTYQSITNIKQEALA